MVRRAIDLSNKANADPSFADEASVDFNPEQREKLPLPPGAMSAAHGLHASTLVRLGRDKDAIIEYSKSLAYLKESGALSVPLTKEESHVHVWDNLFNECSGMTAAEVFLGVATRCAETIRSEVVGEREGKMSWVHFACTNAIESAALCYMRSGNLDLAMSVLEKYDWKDAQVNGMYGAIVLIKMYSTVSVLQDADENETFHSAMKLLSGVNDHSASPLYKWIHLTSQINKPVSLPLGQFLCESADAYLILAKANNSPFDDPDLINLDDKVRLHSVLNGSGCDGKVFWPQGYILPDEYDLFLAESTGNNWNEKKWMLKERSGYGSNGNSIVSADELVSMYDSGGLVDAILCQRIVESPMLMKGHKITLRIYVIYFPGDRNGEELKDSEVYISTEGLVKYASAPFVGVSANPNAADLNDQYMTNSGRGDGRSAPQHSLHQLRQAFQKNGMDYQMMWEGIEESVQVVMEKYAQFQRDVSLDHSCGRSFIRNAYSPIRSIPKIMGFDYILDSSAKPFLLEINRFPGLEPRSSMDLDVKHAIIYDAWIAASDRMAIPRMFVENLRPASYKGYSLKRLALHDIL
ncbi:LOW QUALITY PROTEIN: hypothetical protein ACHAXA_008525 [Cyclostephanos tholiformis]|uniref:Uncharacterized protein n=1 Tax=Cyclostephanos tholiformis TaxID=382380 RepID=A0ABD3R1T2_9STRA